MKRLLLCVALSSITLLAFSQTESVPDPPLRSDSLAEVIADLEAFIPARMKEEQVTGLSIALIRNHQVAWQQGFGFVNSITRERVTPQTVFSAASLRPTSPFRSSPRARSRWMTRFRPISTSPGFPAQQIMTASPYVMCSPIRPDFPTFCETSKKTWRSSLESSSPTPVSGSCTCRRRYNRLPTNRSMPWHGPMSLNP